MEATRAVNQAIGRVIRHRNDYGAIVLLDTRFNNTRIKNQMSKWLRNNIELVTNFGDIMKDLKTFFKNANTNVSSKYNYKCQRRIALHNMVEQNCLTYIV